MRNSKPEDYIGKPLLKVFDRICNGTFGNKKELTELVNSIRNKNDHYLVCADFQSYCQANDLVLQCL